MKQSLAWGVVGICAVLLVGCATGKTVRLESNQKIVVPRDKEKESKAVSEEESERLRPPKKESPMQITSDRMIYQEAGKITLFLGNVQVNQEKAWLYTPYLQVRSELGTASARNGIRLIDHERGVTVTAKELDYQDDLSNIVVRKNVKVKTHDEQGLALCLYGHEMEWNKKSEIVIARGNVVVHYKDTTATADSMTFYQQQKKLELAKKANEDGKDPTVWQKENMITGQMITLLINEKTYEVDGSARAIILPEKKQAKE
jgi:lipopolysaccharide export system protein LptA